MSHPLSVSIPWDTNDVVSNQILQYFHLKQEWESVRRLISLQSRSASTALRLILNSKFVSESVCTVQAWRVIGCIIFSTIKPLARVRFFADRLNICLYVYKGIFTLTSILFCMSNVHHKLITYYSFCTGWSKISFRGACNLRLPGEYFIKKTSNCCVNISGMIWPWMILLVFMWP